MWLPELGRQWRWVFSIYLQHPGENTLSTNGNLNKSVYHHLGSSYARAGNIHWCCWDWIQACSLTWIFPHSTLTYFNLWKQFFLRNMANWSFKRVARLLRSLRRRGTNGQELLASENRRWRPTLPLYHFLKSRLIVLDDSSPGKKNHLGWNSAKFGLVRGAEQ